MNIVAERSEKNPVLSFFNWMGELSLFTARTIRAAVTPPFERKELIRQMDEIGSKSAPLVGLAGTAIGVVMSMQLHDALVRFGGKSLLPAVIVLSLIKETGPIITALVACGRVGAGIGAELGSMKVTEQIDALEASAVDPFQLLVNTRVLACLLMLPLLTILACAFGVLMGWVTNTLVDHISLRLFLQQGFESVKYSDLLPAILKTTVFGFLIGLIGSFEGMRAEKGTEGVGRAATKSVVISSLAVILADVVLVRMIQIFFP